LFLNNLQFQRWAYRKSEAKGVQHPNRVSGCNSKVRAKAHMSTNHPIPMLKHGVINNGLWY